MQKWIGNQRRKRPQVSSSSADVTLKRIKGVKGPNSYNLFCAEFFKTDRGFTIHESVQFQQAQLNIPAFTKGKDQLDPADVEQTRKIASVRIHVERIIGLLRQKYTILQQTLPTDYLICRKGESVPLVDRMIRICSALVNLCPPTVPFD